MTESKHGGLDASVLELIYACKESIDRLLLRGLLFDLLRAFHRAIYTGCFRVNGNGCRDAGMRPETARYHLTWVSTAAP